MRVAIVILFAAGCTGSGGEPPPAGNATPPARNATPLAIVPAVAGSDAVSAAPSKLSYADLMAAAGKSVLPDTIDWSASYTHLVRRFGPVTRVVDRKYFWAAIEGDRCAMFWVGKRKRLEQVAVAVGVMSTEPGGFGYDWCIAMATGGPLPARSGRGEPSTGFDTPTPD